MQLSHFKQTRPSIRGETPSLREGKTLKAPYHFYRTRPTQTQDEGDNIDTSGTHDCSIRSGHYQLSIHHFQVEKHQKRFSFMKTSQPPLNWLLNLPSSH